MEELDQEIQKIIEGKFNILNDKIRAFHLGVEFMLQTMIVREQTFKAINDRYLTTDRGRIAKKRCDKILDELNIICKD